MIIDIKLWLSITVLGGQIWLFDYSLIICITFAIIVLIVSKRWREWMHVLKSYLGLAKPMS